MHDEDLTPAERDAFAKLPRTSDAGDLLEERTVRALADRGLLEPGSARRHSRPWKGIAAAAACAVFFVAGFAMGRGGERSQFAGSVVDPKAMPEGPEIQPDSAWRVATVDSNRTNETRYVMWF